MAENRSTIQIYPGRSLGWITLGASLHGILTRLKTQPQEYTAIDLSYSSSEPVLNPVVVSLPANGIRLRFDGPDQRLRLIEVLDFARCSLTYKNIDLVRRGKPSSDDALDDQAPVSGPPFKHIYNRLFGPSYAGEYIPPSKDGTEGTYVLSYPGVAFSFPLKHTAWSHKADFVSLLSSSAAAPATHMSIFEGNSWPESRESLFGKIPKLPRALALSGRSKDIAADEIDEVSIYGAGKLSFGRRTLPPLRIVLGETTPQDLVAELGPPDAIYRKSDRRISIHGSGLAAQRNPSLSPMMRPESADTEHSSAHSPAEESDADIQDQNMADGGTVNAECFYNYFHHGFDALVSFPTASSLPFPHQQGTSQPPADINGGHLVVTKIMLHGNIPGSYSFNRHRRSRWKIHHTAHAEDQDMLLTSETPFAQISRELKEVWHGSYADDEQEKAMQRGMVLNRGWGESPENSVELLGGFEEHVHSGRTGDQVSKSIPGFSNTELFGFPGLLFEVLKNDTVGCLTVY